LFWYTDRATATSFSSNEEKLGEGRGFGLVYKGYLKEMNLHVIWAGIRIGIHRLFKGNESSFYF
jgi:hypothetical protein